MRAIELFCGTKSFSKVANELGIETVTIDFDKKFNPDICADIFSIKELPQSDIIWASPPCEKFSVASMGKYWNMDGSPKTKESKLAQDLVIHVLGLIEKANPKYFFIENPRGKLRKMPFMKKFMRYTVTYCQYGDKRMKPTDIWTNILTWQPRPVCKNGDYCHAAAPRGSRTGTQGMKSYELKSVVPEQLCREILLHILKNEAN